AQLRADRLGARPGSRQKAPHETPRGSSRNTRHGKDATDAPDPASAAHMHVDGLSLFVGRVLGREAVRVFLFRGESQELVPHHAGRFFDSAPLLTGDIGYGSLAR